MINNERAKLIQRHGVSVDVRPFNASTGTLTKALIGRASAQFNSLLSLEAHRKLHVLPDVDIKSGYLVTDTITGERFLATAEYLDMVENNVSVIAYHALVINCAISFQMEVSTADDNGNVTTLLTDAPEIPAYIEINNMDLGQFKPGLFPEADYVVFCPFFDAGLLNRVLVKKGTQSFPVKVVGFDQLSFTGTTVLYVKTETRE